MTVSTRKFTTELRTGDVLDMGAPTVERVESVHLYFNAQSVQQDEWREVSLSRWVATGEVVDGERVGLLTTRKVRAHINTIWRVGTLEV